MQRLGVRGERAPGGGGVRRLRVVHEADAADLGDELESVRRRRGTARSASAIAASGTPAARAAAVAAAAFSRLCAPGSPGSAGRASSAANSTRRAAPGPAEAARNDRGVLRRLVLEDPQLRVAVRLERAVPVEVVRLEVEEHRDPRAELVDVLELEARQLADDPGLGRRVDPRVARGRRCRQRRPRPREHRAEPLGRRRLAVRPRHADDRVRQAVRQPSSTSLQIGIRRARRRARCRAARRGS